ncbi:Cullin-domain-containing protein [Paraphaeosphaeria sporulosa]|uniref:Cullin-domain-containing protein n=1 Tax=Paraphaeosphaeria sporulosa TaxID=1460663 RepID=A0A177CLR5_9PLEO|nr:Cullin-domain-containing protein [Paraphaeosphaeria sporulosa]OAG07808.1 Cullin-domain-containing protein [Paraphaeosphaeria sporulosa]
MVKPAQSSKTDIETTWQTIEAGLRQILRHPSENLELDIKRYMCLYTAIHNFCTVRNAGSIETEQGKAGRKRGEAYLLGKELYDRLKQSLIEHVQGIQDEARRLPNERLLGFYTEKWDRYTTAAKYNNHLFKYLNRTWVKREIQEGKKDIHDVYMLHLVVWKEMEVATVHEDVEDALAQLGETRQNGFDQGIIP